MLPHLLDLQPVPGELLTPDKIFDHHESLILRQLKGGILPDPAGGFEFVFDQGELTAHDTTPDDRFVGYFAKWQVPIASASQSESAMTHDAGHVQDNQRTLEVTEYGDMIQRGAQRSEGDAGKCKLFATHFDEFTDNVYSLRTGWATKATLDETRDSLRQLIELAEPDPQKAKALFHLLDRKLGIKEIELYANPHIPALGNLAAGKPDAMFTAYDNRVKQAAKFLSKGIIPPIFGQFDFSVNPSENQQLLSWSKSSHLWNIGIAQSKHEDVQLIPAYQWLLGSYGMSGAIEYALDANRGPNERSYINTLFRALGENARLLLSGVNLSKRNISTMRNVIDELTGLTGIANKRPYGYHLDQIGDDYKLNSFETGIKAGAH